MTARATILRTGLVTPVGLGTEQTCASIEAGVPGFRGAAVVDKRFEELTMALVAEEDLPLLDPEPDPEMVPAFTARQRRMLRLGGLALEEVVAKDPRALEIPLFLAGPEAVGAQPTPLSTAFLAQLPLQAGLAGPFATSQIFPFGRAGGLVALQAAVNAIETGQLERALVGGIDSFLDLRLLAELDQQDRIQSPSVMDGFIPGEGAAFLLLARPGSEGSGLAGVCAVASAMEPGHRASDAPYRGDGLAAAVAQTLAQGLSGNRVESVHAGLNGESFGNKEWGVTFTRNQAHMNPEAPLAHLVEFVGDAGAALGPLMLAVAAHGLAEGETRGPCLVWASADGPERAAALLDRMGVN